MHILPIANHTSRADADARARNTQMKPLVLSFPHGSADHTTVLLTRAAATKPAASASTKYPSGTRRRGAALRAARAAPTHPACATLPSTTRSARHGRHVQSISRACRRTRSRNGGPARATPPVKTTAPTSSVRQRSRQPTARCRAAPSTARAARSSLAARATTSRPAWKSRFYGAFVLN